MITTRHLHKLCIQGIFSDLILPLFSLCQLRGVASCSCFRILKFKHGGKSLFHAFGETQIVMVQYMKISILVSLFVTTFDSLTSLTDLGYRAGGHEFDVMWVWLLSISLNM